GGAQEIVAYGRFLLPGLAQLEYRTDSGRIAFISAFLTPTKQGTVHAQIVFTYRWGALCRYFWWLVAPLFKMALKQDVWILRQQEKNRQAFNSLSVINTPLDLLGPKIRLLRQCLGRGGALPIWEERHQELLL
ncbi:MAG: hypothetical protein KDK78_05855, partial [Chlamydiia bacterium]|nr:hypothetical protein [Chlamydiia bacterium]